MSFGVEAKWWYVNGCDGDLAFSHAAFEIHGRWRVHTTTYNFKTKVRNVVTEFSETGFESSLIDVKLTDMVRWKRHRIPRAGGRFYEVVPYATIKVCLDGEMWTRLDDAWYEQEEGPLPVESGWSWTSCRNGDEAWSHYLVDGKELKYRFTRQGTKESIDRLPDHLLTEFPSDGNVTDPYFGFTYFEAPFRTEAGHFGFVERVPAGAFVKFAEQEKVAVVARKLESYASGNSDANRLLLMLYKASQLADDIADCDERPGRVADVMRVLGVEMPGNPFFRAHADVLTATLAQVIDCWEWSNEHEDDLDKTKRVLAYSMKDAAIMYIRQVAFLVGGHEHAKRVLDDAIQFFHGPGGVEPFEVTR